LNRPRGGGYTWWCCSEKGILGLSGATDCLPIGACQRDTDCKQSVAPVTITITFLEKVRGRGSRPATAGEEGEC